MDRRLTMNVRRVVQDAHRDARRFGHSTVGPGHLLLGLVRSGRDGGVRALFSLYGVGVATLEESLQSTLASPGPGVARPPLAPAVRRALDIALREAQAAGSALAGEDHLLVGLIVAADAPMARWFADHGFTAEDVRAALAESPPLLVPPEAPALASDRPARAVIEIATPRTDENADPGPPEPPGQA